jgi:alpha-1,2-mannosyltransferase
MNAHPPTSVLLMLPVASLNYHRALLTWNFASLLMLGASLGITVRGLMVPFSAWSILPTAALILLCQPLRMQFFQGQWNLVLLLLITAAWIADRSGRPWWAGALIGLATAIKLFPAFLFLYFALRRRWSALLAGALTLAALTGLTAAVLGPQCYRTYIHDVLPQLERFRGSWFNTSLVGFWTRLFNPATVGGGRVEPIWRSPIAAQAGILLSWLAVVAVLTRVVRRSRSRVELDHAFWLSVTAMLLVSPIAWDHAFLLLPASAITTYLRLPPAKSATYLFFLVMAILWMWPVTLPSTIIPGGHSHGLATPVHSLTILSFQTYALLALFSLGASVAGNRPEMKE